MPEPQLPGHAYDCARAGRAPDVEEGHGPGYDCAIAGRAPKVEELVSNGEQTFDESTNTTLTSRIRSAELTHMVTPNQGWEIPKKNHENH